MKAEKEWASLAVQTAPPAVASELTSPRSWETGKVGTGRGRGGETSPGDGKPSEPPSGEFGREIWAIVLICQKAFELKPDKKYIISGEAKPASSVPGVPAWQCSSSSANLINLENEPWR